MVDDAYLSSIPKYEEFNGWWFTPVCTTMVRVYKDFEHLGHISLEDEVRSPLVDKHPELLELLQKWKERPEYTLMVSPPKEATPDEMIDCYQKMLMGCAYVRAYKRSKGDPDNAYASVDRVLRWITANSDFFYCPASARYHESFPSGLVRHTLNVIEQIQDLRDGVPKFFQVDLENAILVAAVHDWCKIGLYEQYIRNVKNEQTDQWEKKQEYRYRQEGSPFPFGHGETSMYLAQKFFSLTMEEAAAIRWHMGAYHASKDQLNDLQNSNERFPLVLMLQFADQLAITKY